MGARNPKNGPRVHANGIHMSTTLQEMTPENSPSTLTWRGSHRFSSVMLCTSVNVT